ncbi:MAG: hypothetical protein HYT94_01665 [Parcubacteria group bacterium]|nr:hypothetical protein [Parcubacteria group bacterium]
MKKSFVLHSTVIVAILASVPMFASAAVPTAATNESLGSLVGIVNVMNTIINALLPFMMVLLFVYFFYGLAKYVLSSGDAEKAAEGKTIMIHGVIAIFIGVSIYGIVAWLQVFFSADQLATVQDIQLPDVEIPKVTK